MKRISILLVMFAALLAADAALAQVIPPGGSQFNPPLPAPLPTPKITVPVAPQMDALPRQNYAPAPRPSFSDRITTCLEQGGAAGLGPGDRETYSRSCANR
jgi:hypothetical protein